MLSGDLLTNTARAMHGLEFHIALRHSLARLSGETDNLSLPTAGGGGESVGVGFVSEWALGKGVGEGSDEGEGEGGEER